MFGANSELAPNMFGASSKLASVMEFGFKLLSFKIIRVHKIGVLTHFRIVNSSERMFPRFDKKSEV